jgi:hypothetical protein
MRESTSLHAARHFVLALLLVLFFGDRVPAQQSGHYIQGITGLRVVQPLDREIWPLCKRTGSVWGQDRCTGRGESVGERTDITDQQRYTAGA